MKERENNLVILELPDKGQSLDGVATDADKISKTWETIEVEEQIVTYRKLGRPGNQS